MNDGIANSRGGKKKARRTGPKQQQNKPFVALLNFLIV